LRIEVSVHFSILIDLLPCMGYATLQSFGNARVYLKMVPCWLFRLWIVVHAAFDERVQTFNAFDVIL
jgi:hypothetical protein